MLFVPRHPPRRPAQLVSLSAVSGVIAPPETADKPSRRRACHSARQRRASGQREAAIRQRIDQAVCHQPVQRPVQLGLASPDRVEVGAAHRIAGRAQDREHVPPALPVGAVVLLRPPREPPLSPRAPRPGGPRPARRTRAPPGSRHSAGWPPCTPARPVPLQRPTSGPPPRARREAVIRPAAAPPPKPTTSPRPRAARRPVAPAPAERSCPAPRAAGRRRSWPRPRRCSCRSPAARAARPGRRAHSRRTGRRGSSPSRATGARAVGSRAGPLPDRLPGRLGRERGRGGPPGHPAEVFGQHAGDRRLLQHDLADQHRPGGRARRPPGQVPRIARIPGQHRLGEGRRHDAA